MQHLSSPPGRNGWRIKKLQEEEREKLYAQIGQQKGRNRLAEKKTSVKRLKNAG